MSDEWKELFEGQRPTELALWVRRQGRFASGPPRALADDELLLLGGAGESGRSSRKPAEVRSPTCVALTPASYVKEGLETEDPSERFKGVSGLPCGALISWEGPERVTYSP